MNSDRFCLVLFGLLSVGCQTQKQAYRMICRAHIECTDCQSSQPDERQEKYAEYIAQNLRNPKIRKEFERLVHASPEVSQKVLWEGWKQAGLTECPVLEVDVEIVRPELTLPNSSNSE